MSYLGNLFAYYHAAKEEIAASISDLYGEMYVKIYTTISFLLNFFVWLVSYKIFSSIENEQIALHYNVDFGINYYGDISKVFVIPLLGLIIALLNSLLLVLVSQSQSRNFIAHILFATSILVNVILLVSISLIYLVNLT